MIFISIFDLIKKNGSFKKYLNENKINHYLFTCDLVEYDFKTVYKSFDISYFSNDNDLLGNKFANDDILKDYESIEKVSNNLIVLLIKKFKLKISFMKNFDLSEEIIISEDYNFEIDRLHHADSLIKIAMIKKDYDKWVNSDLSKYDYIFVSQDYFENFDKSNNIFLLHGETVYTNIKHDRNVLYKRKLEKFHYFLNNINFQMVFPKQRDYFKVLNSEYFDDEWYKETYDIYDNTDSVIHFLLVGHDKGYNPGPNFSTREYYECNPDVMSRGVNTLVHYELYGKKENRIHKITDIVQRNYDLISNSPYFDRDWYEHTYEVYDEDCITHYLNEGFEKLFNPSREFSTYEYYECNPQVRKIHINPLVHYELCGKKEHRPTKLPEDTYKLNYSLILNSPYFDENWYKNKYDLDEYSDPAKHYLEIGFVKGFDPSCDFSNKDYYEANVDVEKHGMNPLLHYEKYGRKEKRKLKKSE